MESNQIVSGQAVDNTLQLNKQGGGRIDIPLPEKSIDDLPFIDIIKNSGGANSTIFAQSTQIIFACKLGNTFDIPYISEKGRGYVNTYSTPTTIENPLSDIYYGYKGTIFKFNSDEFNSFIFRDYSTLFDVNVYHPSLNVNFVEIQYESNDGEQFNRITNLKDGKYSINVYYISTYDLKNVSMPDLRFLENEDFSIEFEVINGEYTLPDSIELPREMISCVTRTININTNYVMSVSLIVDESTLKKLDV